MNDFCVDIICGTDDMFQIGVEVEEIGPGELAAFTAAMEDHRGIHHHNHQREYMRSSNRR